MASRNPFGNPKRTLPKMKLHTVFITHNRLELTKQAIASYLETVSVPFSFMVVDNASTDGSKEWLLDNVEFLWRAAENRYPGWACNTGWAFYQPDTTHLHRADNDFIYRPDWCEEVEHQFEVSRVGQVGLRTDKEENFAAFNVGGNCVIRRELWDKGLRYDERPWTEYPPGYSEDSYFSPAVREMGYEWTRVEKPCIIPISNEDPSDPYYQKSWRDRRIYPS